jgi:3-oxoacyl-[acyl-carrier-protein] synthase II
MKAICRDVVVSGLGTVSPFGAGILALWENVRAGNSAVDWIECLGELDPHFYPVRYAAEVKRFVVANHLHNHCPARLGKTAQMGLVAAREALQQARLLDENEHVRDSDSRVSVIIGSGHGPCHETEGGTRPTSCADRPPSGRRRCPRACSTRCRAMSRFTSA